MRSHYFLNEFSDTQILLSIWHSHMISYLPYVKILPNRYPFYKSSKWLGNVLNSLSRAVGQKFSSLGLELGPSDSEAKPLTTWPYCPLRYQIMSAHNHFFFENLSISPPKTCSNIPMDRQLPSGDEVAKDWLSTLCCWEAALHTLD